jgi:hypothetical protein
MPIEDEVVEQHFVKTKVGQKDVGEENVVEVEVQLEVQVEV